MAVLNNAFGLLLAPEAGGGGGYTIDRSVRFNSADSAYLSRTPASAGNRKTWTWSGWVKLGALGTVRQIFTARTSGTPYALFYIFSDDKISFTDNALNTHTTAAVYRDPGAWYHIQLTVDTTDATSANRVRLWVNGTLQTWASTTAPTQNADGQINTATAHSIGSPQPYASSEYFSGYLADVHFIDGQALTPSSFTETDATTGQLIPKAYTGTFGTNGFHLPFSDNSTAAALGTDTSGNGNTWTVNNLVANSLYSSAGFLNPQNAFDGNTGTSAEVNVAAGLGTIVFTSGISVSSSITIKYGSGTSGNIFINGSATAMQATGTQTQTINFSGTLNTLGLQSGSQPVLYYVQIDGGSYLTGANAVNNDSLVDTPTNGSQTDTGVGGEVVGNYCTLNPLVTGQSSPVISNGNLDWTLTQGTILSTFGITAGKYYWEVTANASNLAVGIALANVDKSLYLGYDDRAWAYYSTDGSKYNNYPVNGAVSYGAAWTTGDIVGIAFDADNGTLTFYKNGVSQGTAFTGLTSGPYFPAVGNASSAGSCNFGQRSWAYAAPSGYKALCTTNLPTPTIADGSTVMDVETYAGNSSTQTISGLGFGPDLVWIKRRDGTGNHGLYDSVRGATNFLISSSTAQEGTDANSLTSFNADGFSLSSPVTTAPNLNTSGQNYVAWTWDAGSSTVTNTDGAITSQVRANSSAGFSIVTYTGTGSNGATVGHGLGVAPSFVIIKQRIAGPGTDLYNWNSYHSSLGATKYIALNRTDAATTAPLFNDTAPTSTVFSLGSSTGSWNNVNDASGVTYVAYCFAPVAGYSAFGSYTGNGSADGPFIYTGFRPRWLMIKNTTKSTQNWIIRDTARDTYNSTTSAKLAANLSDAENGTNVGTASQTIADFLSNGFKVRTAGGPDNDLGDIYVWAAFAESPFRYARAR